MLGMIVLNVVHDVHKQGSSPNLNLMLSGNYVMIMIMLMFIYVCMSLSDTTIIILW